MSNEEASCTEPGFGLHTKYMYERGCEMMLVIMTVLGPFSYSGSPPA